MRNLGIPLLIIGLLLSASLSLIMMNHSDGQSHGQCPFKVAGTVDCAQAQNSFDLVIIHLNSVAQFSQATPTNIFTTLLLVFLLAVLSSFALGRNSELYKSRLGFLPSRFYESFTSPSKILFNYWFALHENSPSFIG